MDLKCKEIRCEHNKNLSCMAKKIEVTPKTNCETYTPIPKLADKKYKNHIFEEKPELNFVINKSTALVSCGAECLFNKNGICYANGITVMQSGEHPLCQTFIFK